MRQHRQSSSEATHSTGWVPRPPPHPASMGVGHLLPASSPRAHQCPSLPGHPVGPPCLPPPAHITSQHYSSSPQPHRPQFLPPHRHPYQVSLGGWLILYFVCQWGFFQKFWFLVAPLCCTCLPSCISFGPFLCSNFSFLYLRGNLFCHFSCSFRSSMSHYCMYFSSLCIADALFSVVASFLCTYVNNLCISDALFPVVTLCSGVAMAEESLALLYVAHTIPA